MIEGEQKGKIRRILVALDASPNSLSALRAAAELAARLDAEILGLYVEDIRLLKLSDLPVVREVTFYSSQPHLFDREMAEVQLRAQARSARRALEQLAERSNVRWSFRVVQGAVGDELLAAAEDTDLIILGRIGWSRRRRLGSTARLVVTQAQRPTLVLSSGSRLGLPVGVLYDGSPTALRALGTAVTVLRDRNGYLTIIILAADVQTVKGFQVEIAQWLRKQNLHARYRWLLQADPRALKSLFDAEGCGLLVLPGDSEVLPGEKLTEFLNEVDCPVLLIR